MKKAFAIIALALLLGIACSQATPDSMSATAPTITLTPTPNPAEILAKSGDAVLAMKSARFLLSREGAPVVFEAQTGMTFTEVSGEYQAPDRVSAKIKMQILGNVMEIEMLWLPEGNYMTNPLTGRFMENPAEGVFNGAALFQPDGIPAVLKSGIQNPKRAGEETVEDIPTIHIIGEADGAALSNLTAGALESGTLYPVDVWVEQSVYNLIRFHIAEPDGNGWLIDIFDINAEIHIEVP